MASSLTPASAPLNVKAAAWTVGVHALLLLLLLFVIRFDPPVAVPQEEMGMEVNIGTSTDGSGTNQPLDPEDPAPIPLEMASAAAEPSEVPDVMRGNDDHEVATPRVPTRTTAPPRQQTTSTRPAQPAQQQPRYTYTGATGRGGNSASASAPGDGEGITNGRGDQGVPGGTPGSPNYSGTPGPGTGGMTATISGRNIVTTPSLRAEYREGGSVTIFITVNRDGVITSSRVKRTTNAELAGIAKAKLAGVRFNKSPSGPPEQSGDIIFRFSGRRAQ